MRLPLTSALVVGARADADLARDPARAATAAGAGPMPDCGVEVIEVAAGADGAIDLKPMLQHLAERGLTRMLAEGGARLAAALLREHLVDRLAIFRAPSLIGGDGLPAAEGFGLDRLAELPCSSPRRPSGSAPTVWKPIGARISEFASRPRMHLQHFPHAPARACRMFRPIGTCASLRPCSPESSPISAGSAASRPAASPGSCIETSYDTAGIALGASIACNGVCLSVVDKGPGWFAVDASAETLARTTLGSWRPARRSIWNGR